MYFVVQIDFDAGYFEKRRIIYDETNMRVRTIAFVEFNSTKDFYDILDNYREVMFRCLTMLFVLIWNLSFKKLRPWKYFVELMLFSLLLIIILCRVNVIFIVINYYSVKC